MDGLVLPTILDHNKSVFAWFTIRVKDREQFRDTLQNAGIPTAVHYPLPLYIQPAYAKDGIVLSQADRASQEVVSLPFSPWLSESDQDKVIACIKSR